MLLVVIDTLRADALGSYGNPLPASPNLDAFARRGLRYERAFAHSGWTLPATASLLTGLTPDVHRVGRDPADPQRFGRLDEAVETLAETLGKAGFATGAIVNNTFLAPEFGLAQGFDTYDYEGALRGDHRSAEATVERALAWIDAAPEPWFLVVHAMEPHIEYGASGPAAGRFVPRTTRLVPVPFASPERILRLMQREETLSPAELEAVVGLYHEEVLSVDLALAPLLERADLERDLVAITSDHGEEFFEQGGFEHGHTLVSPVTRVPLILAGRDVAPGTSSTIVQHVDLYRTILDAAYVEAPRGARGASLFELPADAARTAISENCLYGSDMLSLVDGEHRFLLQLATGSAAVWRLGADGMETERLDGDELARVAPRMARALEAERGSLEAARAVAGPSIPDEATFESLKSLGYLGEGR
ncbi:MAG: sulfatase [Planctomycetota bacterium]